MSEVIKETLSTYCTILSTTYIKVTAMALSFLRSIALFLVTCGDLCLSFGPLLHPRPVVVVGKIIIDEYGAPDQGQDDGSPMASRNVNVGGGGPQAAFGAAAALAILSHDDQDPPSPQPITLIGPVGQDDWTEREESKLRATLEPAVRNIHLLKGESLRTPRIQIWHDKDQNVEWKPLNDSFGPLGAQELWRVPRASDFLDALVDEEECVTCHVILEGGAKSPGDGEDSVFLVDHTVRERIKFLGVEPVVFTSETTGRVEGSDIVSCKSRLDRITPLEFVSPDNLFFRDTDIKCWRGIEVAVRDGPRGSLVIESDGTKVMRVPAAKLTTVDGKPVNPTGAGNAYAAAFSACRGSGASIVDSACIATAVGAIVCQFEHLPPWSVSVMSRIREAAIEVSNNVVEEVKG